MAELDLKIRFASSFRTLAQNYAVAMVLKLARQTDLRCLWVDECTASNNCSLDEKKTWLVIETSQPQAEKKVKSSVYSLLPYRAGGQIQMWRVSGRRLGWGSVSTVSQMDHVGSSLVAWHCCRHPVDFTSPKAINGLALNLKKRKNYRSSIAHKKICFTQQEAHNLATSNCVKQNRS